MPIAMKLSRDTSRPGRQPAAQRQPESLAPDALRQQSERAWLAENAAFIAAYNRAVEEEGLPLADHRAF